MSVSQRTAEPTHAPRLTSPVLVLSLWHVMSSPCFPSRPRGTSFLVVSPFHSLFGLGQTVLVLQYLMKAELLWLPIVGWKAVLARDIFVHRSTQSSFRQLLRSTTRSLNAGNSIMTFPGTASGVVYHLALDNCRRPSYFSPIPRVRIQLLKLVCGLLVFMSRVYSACQVVASVFFSLTHSLLKLDRSPPGLSILVSLTSWSSMPHAWIFLSLS